MASNEFIASDAFGDFFFFGSSNSSNEPMAPPSSAESPSRTGAAVFMFPVRSRAAPSNKQLICTSSVDSSHYIRLDPTPDATATLVLRAPTRETDRACKQGPNIDDDVATNGGHDPAKPEMQSGVEYGYGRSASLDTGNAPNNRDQCQPPDTAVPIAGDGKMKTSLSLSPEENPWPHSQYMAPYRSGSSGGSSGGGGPGGANQHHHHHHHHHNGWHSTEWWRSFSSSRLNEMTTEEPDKRSPEMLKVPYTGGAEPMYVLVHGSDPVKSD
ncbi:hypothetical protein Vretimale_1613 [Volvox reticuliferus]|uniref:Uncharacterized protein n=1 Tax=Volvox reticuliferus TaxID=1737510 RepID=A0A8J4CRF9_9CHLO|nr:hypothetical protein Vretifemale_15471 [Volvox reticuliferus]GIL95632.1 hypothetical protein Vretimale_1613 [Volvox reticuliferus]